MGVSNLYQEEYKDLGGYIWILDMEDFWGLKDFGHWKIELGPALTSEGIGA